MSFDPCTYLHAQGGAAADDEGEEEEEGDQRLAIQMDVSVDTGTCNICAAKVRTESDTKSVKPLIQQKCVFVAFRRRASHTHPPSQLTILHLPLPRQYVSEVEADLHSVETILNMHSRGDNEEVSDDSLKYAK